ncbi:putative quinol monooxygenase [Rhodococcus coprophilus]|uniref:Antibiotic biosynthesis monooxygenase n=1 Tax=Rhodococcus coprophilus TaxID=38310 RepID=A0A2X4U435_9NOCA|nr:putative quinol monooxygenase [Rhodococcus coprophilus]MBM7459015.1 quinol monooxygenase YgiN [Rhodococcus coprophilus]SQI34546.1 antibiotic biosynthesis monooxygenase [Rhodococcus coprophilus]
MIFIVVRFKVLPEHQDDWLATTAEFTESTRKEPGNLWFDWSRSVDDPSEFVLVEAFRDGDAGAAHVKSDHFRNGLDAMRPALAETPRILNTEIPGTEWSRMGELEIS